VFWKAIDKVVIKPGGKKVNSLFEKVPYMQGAKPCTVFLNGKPSTICLPENYKVNIVGNTKSGRVFGNFSAYFSGAYSGVNSFAFHTLNGRVELILHKRIGSGSPVAFREPDTILGIETDGYAGYDLEDFVVRSWGWTYQRGKVRSLGPAEEVWFAKNGSIAGYFICNKSGKAGSQAMPTETVLYRSVNWKDGKRVEGWVSSIKPSKKV
jgi:hypothetical protein